MRLNAGNKAPDFAAIDTEGNKISLEALKGKKILLSFYRYASCPFCNLRVHNLIQRYPGLKKENLSIISIFQSSNESINKSVGQQQAPFPIVGDPGKGLYKLYGVESSWLAYIKAGLQVRKIYAAIKKGFFSKKPRAENGATTVPADFLIDENGIIKTAYYGKDISDHIPMEQIESFAKHS